MSKKKILIIYEKMGMGHFRMANILKDMLDGDDVEITVTAGSDIQQTDDVYTIVKLWNYFIKKNLIRSCDILINFALRMLVLPFLEAKQDAVFMEKLSKIEPDIIISTADGFNKAIGSYTSERNIPFYIFITEISTFNDLVNANATHICYFNETPEAIRSYDFEDAYFSWRLDSETTFLKKTKYVLRAYNDFVLHAHSNSIFRNPNRPLERMNNAKCEVIGPLAEKKHFTRKDSMEMKNKLGIPTDRDTVLIASGSIGGGFLMEMVRAICRRYTKPVNLLVICGRDKDVYDKVTNYMSKNKNNMINIMPFEYINNFEEYLSAADCIIARPSAGIFIESMLHGVPMLTFDKVTSNDKGSLTMIEKYSIGEVCSDKGELVPAMEKLLAYKDEYKDNIDKLLSGYYSTYEDKKEALRSIILDSPPIVVNTEEDIREDDDYDVEVTYNHVSH
jgi:UDP-N-acetylglucosamine:LPS N-acetylglucosamine transferase